MRPVLGNDIELGRAAENCRPLFLPSYDRDKHLYVCGATGTGKSKFLENLIRQDIKNWRKSRCGLLLLDPHGSLYDSLMRWLAWADIDRPVIPIDLRRADWTVSYNVLRPRPVSDPSVVVDHFVQAMAHVWGKGGTAETPLFARWAANILWTLYEKKQTLVETEFLTNRMAKRVRRAMTENLTNPTVANDWEYADSLSPKDFEAQIGSTLNRLYSFLANRSLRRTFGNGGQSLDLQAALDEGHIILVSLATERGRVSEDDAALFATLLLSDLWVAAKERGKGKAGAPPKPFYVYADEFQNFVTPTIAKNLDQARGFGLHLTLANQFPNQLLHAGPHGTQVYDSVMVNARSKVVFSLEGEDNLRPLAQALFTGVMNPDKIKHEIYSTKVMGFREEQRTARGKGRGHGSSRGRQSGQASGEGFGETFLDPESRMAGDPASASWSQFGSASQSEQHSESESTSEFESTSSVLVPILGKELSSVQFESLEDQLFRAMAQLVDQKQRHCIAKIVGSKLPALLSTPTVKDVPGRLERLDRYIQGQLQSWPFMVKSEEADKRLKDRAAEVNSRFLEVAATEEPATARRRLSGT